MLSDLEYVRQSIESDLIYTRLMMDHSIFLEIMISYENDDIVNIYKQEKEDYTRFMHILLDIGIGVVSEKVLNQSTLVTKYTSELEKKTKGLFNIDIDTSITERSLNLVPIDLNYVSKDLVRIVDAINMELLKKINETMDKLIDLDKMINNNKVYLFNPEDMVTHFIKETRIFKFFLEFIIEKYHFTPTYIYNNMYYYNDCFKDHSYFIKNLLYPINSDLSMNIYRYLNNYSDLFDKFNNEINPYKIDELSSSGLNETLRFKNYEIVLTNKILNNKFNLIIPLSCDHIIRESSIYISNLEKFNGNK